MKAKACTFCRQNKARCDVLEGQGACSRCRSLKLACVYDAGFKRTSKSKRIQQMTTEIERLRQALHESATNTNAARTEIGGNVDETTVPFLTCDTSLSTDQEEVPVTVPEIPNLVPAPALLPSQQDLLYKAGDDIELTTGQVNAYFKGYFSRCHQYLAFKMKSQLPDDIYLRSSFLFWVICSVSSTWTLRARLAPVLQAMVGDAIHSGSPSIETVQALLILCIWPYSITRLADDPSAFYSALAIQLSLQLGLHCPSQAHSHRYADENLAPTLYTEVRLTTWIACFVVSQMQSSFQGLPPLAQADLHLLTALDHPAVDTRLSQLCRIYQLLTRSNLAICSNAATSSGMLEPEARLHAVTYHGELFRTLESQHLGGMDDSIKVAFISSRLQLWSLVLLDDMPVSVELQALVRKAEQDACDLIDLCYSRNLSGLPYYFRRSMCDSAFVIVKLLRLQQTTERDVLENKIQLACQALRTMSNVRDDIYRKTCHRLEVIPCLEDKKISSPIYSRMGASLLFDLLRIYMENESGYTLTQEINFFDLNGMDWTILAP